MNPGKDLRDSIVHEVKASAYMSVWNSVYNPNMYMFGSPELNPVVNAARIEILSCGNIYDSR